MSAIKIDKGIPIPAKFPFKDMEVGDSFLIPGSTERTKVSVYASRYGERHGMRFTVRKTPEGYRCWRIA